MEGEEKDDDPEALEKVEKKALEEEKVEEEPVEEIALEEEKVEEEPVEETALEEEKVEEEPVEEKTLGKADSEGSREFLSSKEPEPTDLALSQTPTDEKSKSITPRTKSASASYRSSGTKKLSSEQKVSIKTGSIATGTAENSVTVFTSEANDVVDQSLEMLSRTNEGANSVRSDSGGARTPGAGILHGGSLPGVKGFPCIGGMLPKRSPFIHNPPQPEERRPRIPHPRTPREYIINLREDLADFQESHGLPRTRDYSFLSLGLALAQETGRAVYSLFQMFTELFPILAIVSLILRFALDKLIEILETTETISKLKKSVIFALEMLAIMVPLWILIGTIIIPLITLIFSIFKRMLQIKGGKKKVSKPKPKPKPETCAYK